MKEFENFISYRRQETGAEANLLYDSLTKQGYSTFLDVHSLDNGRFDENLLDIISNCTNFILILTKDTLVRCKDKKDWIYRELRQALLTKKNIICVFVGEVLFPTDLPQEISEIENYNGIVFDFNYYDKFVEKLISRFLVTNNNLLVSNDDSDFVIDGTKLIAYVGNAGTVIIPNNVTCIGERAFKDKTHLIKIVFPESIEIVEDGAFERCLNMVSLKIPQNTKIIGKKSFSRCYNLAFIELNDTLETISDEAFSYCSKLKWINIPKGVKNISTSAFNGCTSLELINVESGNESFEDMDGILTDVGRKTIVRCPENYKEDIIVLPSSINELASYSFSKCINIRDIILPSELRVINSEAFAGCCGIHALTLPDSIIEMDTSAFKEWTTKQKVITSKRFNQKIKYLIESTIDSNNLEKTCLNNEFILVKTTFESNTEAKKMAKMLLEYNYIISGQISKLNSIYRWEGEISDECEYELSCITLGSKYYDVEKFIIENHSYELCQIMVIPIIHTSEIFGAWLRS